MWNSARHDHVTGVVPYKKTTGNPGSVIVPQYGSSKITVFVWGKNTILKFLRNTKKRSMKLTLQLVVVVLNAPTKFPDNLFKFTLIVYRVNLNKLLRKFVGAAFRQLCLVYPGFRRIFFSYRYWWFAAKRTSRESYQTASTVYFVLGVLRTDLWSQCIPCSVLSAKSNLELQHNRIPQTTTWFVLYNVKTPTQNENIHRVNSVLYLPTTINISYSLLLSLEALNSPSCPHLLNKTVPIH